VNRYLCSHAEIGRYATMFFGILDKNGNLDFINAGHPSPFLVRRGEALDAFKEGSYPVGLVPEAEYTTAKLRLQPGDTLVMYSDGVTEAMDPDDELYGMNRLREVLTGTTADCPLEAVKKSVLESVETFTRGARQADDLTMLIVRYRAAAEDALTDTDVPASSSASA
jgi:sigma-B regulation protein RsbU (phosphoserine phosphatase)